MIYLCGWRSKRSQGSIEVDVATAKDARKKARADLRDGFGLRVHIVSVMRWEAGIAREKSK